jgi:FkbM family methyltransferase
MKFWIKLKRAAYRGLIRNRFRIINRKGINYLVNYKNSIDRKLIINGGYEEDQLAVFSEFVDHYTCTIFYDVGANIGLYSVNVSLLPSIEKTYAFEPASANICQLSANLLLNNLQDSVEIKPFGLSDKEAEVIFLENTGNSTGRSRIKVTNQNELDTNKFIEKRINVYPLDDISTDKDKKIAIKIDVEGHEERAIKGMTKLLGNNYCLLQVESYDKNAGGINSLMEGLGYYLLHEIDHDHYYGNFPRA